MEVLRGLRYTSIQTRNSVWYYLQTLDDCAYGLLIVPHIYIYIYSLTALQLKGDVSTFKLWHAADSETLSGAQYTAKQRGSSAGTSSDIYDEVRALLLSNECVFFVWGVFFGGVYRRSWCS